MKTLQTVLLIVLIVGVIAVTGTLIAVLSGKLKYEMFQVRIPWSCPTNVSKQTESTRYIRVSLDRH